MERGGSSIVLSDDVYNELCRYWSSDETWDGLLKKLLHYAQIAGLKPNFNTKEGIAYVRSQNSRP